MSDEAKLAMEHNIFTPGNYFYNGVGHVTVQYDKVLAIGYRGIMAEAMAAKKKLDVYDPEYVQRNNFLAIEIIVLFKLIVKLY